MINYVHRGEDMKKGRLVGQGRTAEIFALEDKKVLKLFRADMAHKSVEKEYALGRTITQLGVPAPAIYAKVTLEDRQGIIYEHVTGKTMLEKISGSPWSVKHEARRLARLHYEIHRHRGAGLVSQKQNMLELISRASVLTNRELQQILDYLDCLPQGEMLCHGDFHPDNVMVSSQNAIVLDWMNAVSGCPAGDVARTVLLLRDAAPPPGTAGWRLGLLNTMRRAFLESYLREYYKISNLTPDQVEAWILPVAAARLTEDLPPWEKEILLRIIRQKLDLENKN